MQKREYFSYCHWPQYRICAVQVLYSTTSASGYSNNLWCIKSTSPILERSIFPNTSTIQDTFLFVYIGIEFSVFTQIWDIRIYWQFCEIFLELYSYPCHWITSVDTNFCIHRNCCDIKNYIICICNPLIKDIIKLNLF